MRIWSIHPQYLDAKGVSRIVAGDFARAKCFAKKYQRLQKPPPAHAALRSTNHPTMRYPITSTLCVMRQTTEGIISTERK